MLDKLQYTDGKSRDEIDQIESREKLMGADKISPFGTGDKRVFKRKLENMNSVQMKSLAQRVGCRIAADQEIQKDNLLKAFNEWQMTNWGSTGTKTEEMVSVFGDSDTVEDFEKSMSSKTLSELQEMAMKLGFTPSFDRNRIIKVLRQDYLSRS